MMPRTFIATVIAVMCSTAFPMMGSRIRPTNDLLRCACSVRFVQRYNGTTVQRKDIMYGKLMIR